MKTIDRILNELKAGKTISQALSAVYEKRIVHIPFNDADLDVEIYKLKMPNRTTNALMRHRLKTIGDVVEYADNNRDGLRDVQNLGKTSIIDLMERVLDYCWDHMSVRERAELLLDLVERNKEFERV